MHRFLTSLGAPTLLLWLVSFASAQEQTVSDRCAEAFESAANVSAYQDTHEDLFPAYSACSSVEEWRAADQVYPEAIDGVDPVRYAMTVCASNQQRLGDTPICRAVNAAAAGGESDLSPSGETGLLGVPLPAGAELIERTPGGAGRDPRERYRISASADDIGTFFDREMVRSGWSKDGLSTDAAHFFRKGNLMLGVLINSDGGTFTLMGS